MSTLIARTGVNHWSVARQLAIDDAEPLVERISIAHNELDTLVVAEMLWHSVHGDSSDRTARRSIAHVHRHTAIAHQFSHRIVLSAGFVACVVREHICPVVATLAKISR